jgi:hypothetical protein
VTYGCTVLTSFPFGGRLALCPDWCGLTGYFRVTEDLKFFNPEPITHSSKGTIYFFHFRMLAENITENTYFLRIAGKTGGTPYRYFFDGDVQVLSTDGLEKESCWNCYRVAESELPDYFEPEYLKAMEQHWV